MNICIIPARGGSKRIPRKNIRDFAGKPMIAHSISAAKESGVFDRIIVSTDDQEIADVAAKHGAEIPFLRPANLSDDHATTASVIEHALTVVQATGDMPDYACCIYATAPFAQPKYIKKGLALITAQKSASAFSVTTFPYPIQRALKIDSAGHLDMFFPEFELTRSNDLEEAFHDAGQFYWVNAQRFLQSPQIFCPDAVPIILPRYLVQDIDTPEDWITAEFMFTALSLRLSRE